MALRYLPSIELVITILAFLKCGIAYVPIAPNWPSGRIRLVLEDAKPAMVFTNTKVELIYKAISELEDECSIPSVYQVQGVSIKIFNFRNRKRNQTLCSIFLCTFKGRVEFQRFDYTSCRDKSTSETAFNL